MYRKEVSGVGLTEPDHGSDAMGIQLKAHEEKGAFQLNGSKMFITNGSVAETFIIFARTTTGTDAKGITAFIVEKDSEGFSVGQPLRKMGMRASPTNPLYFSNCRVPAENILGAKDKGAYVALAGLDVERAVLSGIALGLMNGAFNQAVAYAKQRRQFGRPIADFQLIQDLITRMGTKLHAARCMVYETAKKLEAGARITMEASYAKLFAGRAATEVTLDAIQVLGGYGYTREFSVERLMRDAKLGEIGAGTNQIQSLVIAREILGREGAVDR